MYGNSPLCPTGHQPFGAAAQKGASMITMKRCTDDDDDEEQVKREAEDDEEEEE